MLSVMTQEIHWIQQNGSGALLVGVCWLLVWFRRKKELINKLKISLDNRELGPIIVPEMPLVQPIHKEEEEKKQGRVLEETWGDHLNKPQLQTIMEEDEFDGDNGLRWWCLCRENGVVMISHNHTRHCCQTTVPGGCTANTSLSEMQVSELSESPGHFCLNLPNHLVAFQSSFNR